MTPSQEEASKEPDLSLVKEGVLVNGKGNHLCSTGQSPLRRPGELSTDTGRQQGRDVWESARRT